MYYHIFISTVLSVVAFGIAAYALSTLHKNDKVEQEWHDENV